MKYLKIFIAVCVVSCSNAPLTPDEQHEREDALIVEKEQFWIKYDQCIRRGTVVFSSRPSRIRRHTKRGERPDLDIWDMRSARCVPDIHR